MMAAAVPTNAQTTEADQSFVRWMTVAGAGVGAALDVFYLFTLQTGYEPETSALLRGTIIGTTSLIQLGTATAAFWGMGKLITRFRPEWWQAGLAGPVYGALAGALSFGLFMGTAWAIAIPTGAITVNPDADFWGSCVDTWYGGFGRGFLGGAAFGMIFGAIGGTVAAPTASIIYRRAVE
jgi:hypothetical protein